MIKKFLAKIELFFRYLFFAMRAADSVIAGEGGKNGDGGVTKESKVQNEQHKVCQDLLRGELTEEVKELRYEMYHAERESHKYEYTGGGRAKRKKNIFGYNGTAENEDGRKILLLQENKVDTEGVYSDMDPNKRQDEYTFKVKRDFIPTNRIEEFARQVVVKDNGDGKFCLDIYFDQYSKQFDRRSRIFLNNLLKILDGDRRSEILEFTEFSFVTERCYGSDDNISHTFVFESFDKAFMYEGSIILRFICNGESKDLLDEIYHKETAEKNEAKAPRDKNESTINFYAATETDTYDVDAAMELLKGSENGEE